MFAYNQPSFRKADLWANIWIGQNLVENCMLKICALTRPW